MMRWISLACVLIVLVGAAAFVYQIVPEPVPEPTAGSSTDGSRPASGGPPPKLEVGGGKSHQFGTMIVGGKDAHSWEFKNVGAGPLEVWLEETTCSCTVATLKSSSEGEPSKSITIAPGRSAPIVVDWEARKAGKFGQAATIGTNDPDNHSVVLTILGMVVPPVEVRPSDSITFSEGSAEETRKATVSVVANDRPELKLTRVATSRPGLIVAEARPMAAEELGRLKVKAGYTVTVEVKPGLPTGRFAEDLLIETDHPKQPSLKVPLTGNTVGPIAVIPSRIGMPSVASAAGGSQELALIVRGHGETHFQVASKPANVRVDITPESMSGGKGRYRLTVTVPPGTSPGLVDDPVVLKTDHPKVKELRIPVAIYVSSRTEGG